MDSRKSLDLNAAAMMLVICFVWALQQIGLKATADLATPVMQIGLRSGLAAICVWFVIRLKGERIAWSGRTAVAGAVAGSFFAVEFLLIGLALDYTTASHVVVFLYTAPVFAALGLHWKVPGERLAIVQWLGIGCAACGIAIAFLWRQPGAAQGVTLHGDLLALIAAMIWGSTTVLIRTTGLARLPATHTLFYQLAGAFALLVAAAVVTGQAGMTVNALLISHLAAQAILIAFLSFLGWFWLLTRYVASQLGVFTFLTPMFGVVLGIVFLGEPLTTAFAAGAVAVLTGIVLVSAWPWFSNRRNRRSTGKRVPEGENLTVTER